MRITYRTLAALIGKMNEDQKDCDVTLEVGEYGVEPFECFAVELRICGEMHGSLDEDHPVLYLPSEELGPRSDNVNEIWQSINGE